MQTKNKVGPNTKYYEIYEIGFEKGNENVLKVTRDRETRKKWELEAESSSNT